jgi:pimeloyl-ACP methyl ester carboxylesterase
MFVDKKWGADADYIARRVEMANLPGAWEATAAARFKAPFRGPSARAERDNIDYANISVPVLVFAGKLDPLRNPGYTDGFVPHIRRCDLHVFENAGHMGNIECADVFNARVLEFLAKA